ncbi:MULTISPECIES: YjbF family lipoprotein [Gammaproteobacteria]|uniref:YjbF family lipoprotein n=1 Tax=Gammaproteobacteria TaxID=1236 RepID=UPI000DD01A62|nr:MULTISPECIES: YjbF family lipoprotein [Gammaproteobacteria]RTE86047.1 hypothetical protein DQX04_05605 [Aliidiomarina sp. B3213]TCZ91401.1 hypothetical protein EYQ95_05615 [Lysobacter sp. N42]
MMKPRSKFPIVKAAVVGASALLLGACSSVFYDARKTIEYAFEERPDVSFTQEELEQMPYTVFYGQIEGQQRTAVILGFADWTNEIPRLSWVSGGRQSLSTEYARIISTSGLDRDLVAMSDISDDPLRCLVRDSNNCTTQWIRQIDMEGDGDSRGVTSGTETIISDFTVYGPETLMLPMGEEKQVYRVEEEGRFVFARQDFNNTFWIEPDGHVVKSKQVMMPNTFAIELTQVKWVGRDGN